MAGHSSVLLEWSWSEVECLGQSEYLDKPQWRAMGRKGGR